MDLPSDPGSPLTGLTWERIHATWVGAELLAAENSGTSGTEISSWAKVKSQGALVGERCVGVATVGGGHLVGTATERLGEFQHVFRSTAKVRGSSPAEYARTIVTAVCELTEMPQFERCLVQVSLTMILGDQLLFVWRVGANGAWVGTPNALVALGQDHRKAEMVRKGVVPPSVLTGKAARVAEEATSMLNVQTPFGFETHLVTRGPPDVLMLLNQGAEPFGPRPAGPISSHDLFLRDAAWRHGFPSHGVTLSTGEQRDLGWPGTTRTLELI